MNKKLIAAAVSAAVVVPVTASAEVTVYGRIDNGIEISDSGSGSTTNMVTGGSRFGFKASSDLGNGMTASGRYEFGTTTDARPGQLKTSAGDKFRPSGLDLRIGTVSLAGSFGSVTLGNQWSSFFNSVGTHADPTRYLGGAGGGIHVFRTANTLKYANSVGPLSLELDLRVDDAGSGDGAGLGISVAVNDNLTLAVAFDSAGNPDIVTDAVDPILGTPDIPAMAAINGVRNIGNEANPEWEYYTTTVVDSSPDNLSDQDNTVTITHTTVVDDTDTDGVDESVVVEADQAGRPYVPATMEIPGTPDISGSPEMRTANEDTDRVGVAAKVTFGSMFGMLSLINKEHGDVEISATQLWVGSDVGDSTRVMVGYGQEDHNMAAMDAARDDDGDLTNGENPSALFAGVYHSLGGGLSVAYEGKSSDNDVDGDDSTTTHRLAMRYNF